MTPHISIIEPEGPESWYQPLSNKFSLEFIRPDAPLSSEQIDPILSRSSGVIITSATGISNAQLEKAADLRIIAKCGGAPSNIDIAHAERCGIAVSCVPGANTTTIAEYTVMLMIAALRRFDLHAGVIRNGRWRTADSLIGRDLRDATVGIVGLGAIGHEVLCRLRPFGCKILVYSPHAASVQNENGFKFVESLDELLPQCDVVTLHCKVTTQTVGLIDRRRLGLFKRNAVLINTARGALVDEEALADALRDGLLSAAAVDVFRTEPPQQDHPLLRQPNAIITPHSSGWTEQALRRECDGAVRSVLAYFEGAPIPGLLTPDYIQYLRK